MSSNLLSVGTPTIERMEYIGDKMQVQELERKNINILKNFCPLLHLLSEEFVSKLYMIQICGETLDAALLMTTDLMIYGLGNNEGSQLGIGYMTGTLQPVLIGILSGKKIKKLIYLKNPVVFALTEEGQIYSWGSNENSILGFEEKSSAKVIHVPSLITSFRKERIIDIAASECHAVALTESGKIYLWGSVFYYVNSYDRYNSVSLFSQNVTKPQIVSNDESELCEIKHICCGEKFTIAVTKEGIYGTGINTDYQLRISDESSLITNNSITFKLIFPNDKILKVACGASHVMALDDEGNLYVWGSNKYGQLGIKSSVNKSIRTLLNEPELGKIINIAALSHKDISVALNDEGRIYVWGYYLGLSCDVPQEIHVSDMCEVFGCNFPYIIRTSTVKYSDNSENTDIISEMFQNMETMFDDSSISDLTIRVQGKTIHVHKGILNIRSKYFRNMFQQTEWKTSNQSVMEHDEFSYDIYKCFLRYLYTGKIDLPVEKTLDLLALADTYKETELMNCCIQILKNECTKENNDKFVTLILNTIRSKAQSVLPH